MHIYQYYVWIIHTRAQLLSTLYVQTRTYWETCKEDTSPFACMCLTNGHDPGTASLDNSLLPWNKGRAAALHQASPAPTWSTKLTMTGRNGRSLAAIARHAAKVYIHLYDPVRPCHDWVSEVKKEVGKFPRMNARYCNHFQSLREHLVKVASPNGWGPEVITDCLNFLCLLMLNQAFWITPNNTQC